MKIERYRENKKVRNTLLTLGIASVLLGGGIIYRSYATYQENKSYNVIKGTIPDFGYDIKLAYTINGKEDNKNTFPSKDSEYVGQKVSCKNNVTAEWDNINWGLKNIQNTNSETIRCTVDFKTKETFSEKVKPGDYVKMTPVAESYTVLKELTGHTEDQTINPQELNLWRVLQINSDGTVDMISEYTSSKGITFKGETGYKNCVGVLNDIASAYTNSKYTIGSRYPGYKGQTEFITASLSAENLDTEAKGAGEGYNTGSHMNDFNLIQSVLHTRTTYSVGKQGEDNGLVGYWFSGRNISVPYKADFDFDVLFLGLSVESNNNLGIRSLYGLGGTSGTKIFAWGRFLRPIITLKSNLTATGEGTKEEPWSFE